jgi:hypothetical protein
MTDCTESEGSEGSENVGLESLRARKRKFTPDGEGEGDDGPERKRTSSPGTFASKDRDSMVTVSEG